MHGPVQGALLAEAVGANGLRSTIACCQDGPMPTGTRRSVTSRRPGMGAWPYDGGVTFRVWAPNATAVAVTGTFDDWDATRHPLVAEEGGTWSVDVAGARDGDEYRFLVSNGDREMWRIDPRAR